jgi:hypothetical protein
VGFALLAILAYIWFRFEWQYGVGAVVALIHDAFTTLGLFSLFGLEFNLATVAALLTIVGYSINDTVVIYDRIRENLRRYKTMPLADLTDRSINETLARTTMTSFTTLLAVRTRGGGRAGDPRLHDRDDLGRADRHILDDLRGRADAPAPASAARGRGRDGGCQDRDVA